MIIDIHTYPISRCMPRHHCINRIVCFLLVFLTDIAWSQTALNNYTLHSNTAISGYNALVLYDTPLSVCATHCDEAQWCVTFDFRPSDDTCVLQDNPLSATTTSSSIYNHYTKNSVYSPNSNNGLTSISAMVIMQIDLYASVSGLDSLILTTADISGSANAKYTSTKSFTLETNGEVNVEVSGTNLSNATGELPTSYTLNSSGTSFSTQADSVHLDEHTLSIETTLGDILDQLMGTYSSSITLTVTGAE